MNRINTTRDATANNNRPRAWLNIIVFDEQMNMVITNDGKNSYFEQAGVTNVFKVFNITNREITKNGYVYIYVSNETPNVDVYFDNLQVTDIRSPLIEEEHYYGSGLIMEGISCKSLNYGKPENKYKFVNQLLDDEFELNFYQFTFRNYDPQIARFVQIDPLSDKYVYNTTYSYAENKFINSFDVEGLEAKLAIAGVGHENTHYTQSDINAFKDRAQRLERIAGFIASQVQNGNQIINQLKQATASEGSVSSVVFFAHSSGVGLYLDDNQGFYTDNNYMMGDMASSVIDLKNAVQSGEIKFDQNAVIVFGGCNTESTDQLSNGQVSLALSVTKQVGITTYGATGQVSPELDVNGKETGRLITDGNWVKNERVVSSSTVSFKLPIIGKISFKVPKVTYKQTNTGKVLDPKKVVSQTSNTQ